LKVSSIINFLLIFFKLPFKNKLLLKNNIVELKTLFLFFKNFFFFIILNISNNYFKLKKKKKKNNNFQYINELKYRKDGNC
jgi:hypothetical protein